MRILLFGSSARGDDDAFSDLDLIVVANDIPTRFLDRISRAYDLIEPRFALDLLIYTPEEFAAMKQAQRISRRAPHLLAAAVQYARTFLSLE